MVVGEAYKRKVVPDKLGCVLEVRIHVFVVEIVEVPRIIVSFERKLYRCVTWWS